MNIKKVWRTRVFSGLATSAIFTFSANVYAAAAPSENGAKIPALTQIVDAKSNVWTVNSGVVYENGKKAAFTSGVVSLLYYHGVIYQENSAKNFWSWNGTAWVGVSSDPRDVSPNATYIPSSTNIVDATLNVWAISGGYIYKNGVKDATNANIIQLLYFGGVLYKCNNVYAWWSYSGSAWKARNGLGDPRVTSASGANIPASTSVIDSGHNVWSLVSGVVYENGRPAGDTSSVNLLEYFNGAVYRRNSQGLIWTWNGSAWVGANSVEFALPAAVKALGYTNNAFTDEFDTLDSIDVNNTLIPGFDWYVKNYSTGDVTPAKNITQVNVNGISAVRIDGAGGGFSGAQKIDGQVVGRSFEAHHGGGAYYEANIAYGQTGAHDVPIKSITKGTTTLITLTSDSVCHPFAPLFCPANGGTNPLSNITKYEIKNAEGITAENGIKFAASPNVGGVKGAWTVTLNVDSTGWGTYTGGGLLYSGAAWPAFWANPTAHLLDDGPYWAGQSAADIAKEGGVTHYLEMDIMEYFTGATTNYNATLIDWWGEFSAAIPSCSTIGYCAAQESQGIPPAAGALPLASTEAKPVFHKYGALWVPSAPNSQGVYQPGYLQWFLDGAEVAQRITWTGPPPTTVEKPVAPWKYSVLDGQAMSIIFDTSGGPFMYVDYVSVWQLP